MLYYINFQFIIFDATVKSLNVIPAFASISLLMQESPIQAGYEIPA